MEQIFLVVTGSIVAVCHILSPVTLMERMTMVLERFGKASAPEVTGGTQKARNYYVRGVK